MKQLALLGCFLDGPAMALAQQYLSYTPAFVTADISF
jgi:hypothetical protein